MEFLGIWEQVHNPNFNYGGFVSIKTQAGLNNYKLSAKEWVAQTNAIGLVAKAGRYGGTYAHKDIAFEFGMWSKSRSLITTLMKAMKGQCREKLLRIGSLNDIARIGLP